MASRRIKLRVGKQRELIEKAKAKNNFSWKNFAVCLDLNESYLQNELRYEITTLRQDIFEALCFLAGKDYAYYISENLDSKWGQRKGGANSNAGGKGLIRIKKPKFDERFAELVGAYLGDGTLTKYFMRITEDKRYCLPHLEYLGKLAQESFGVKPTVRISAKRNTAFLEIRSKQFCDYFRKNLGISFGDKIRNKARIPKCILKDENLAKACLRGLMDTDGSLSKRGNQMCLEFTSKNLILLEQVWLIGKQLGIFTHRNKEQAGTNSWGKIVQYFECVGSSNRIHIIRFGERQCNQKLLYKTDLFPYFKKYDGVRIPFVGPWSSG